MARWTKKSIVFAVTEAEDQITFIDKLKRKIKMNFSIQADQRGITVTLRGDPEQVRFTLKRIQDIYRALKKEIVSDDAIT
jgi:hypothetical protein